MKQRELIKKLASVGFKFLKHGSNHDIYSNGSTKEPIPRHNEIDEGLAKLILRRNGYKGK